ncbi:MAG TPA: LysR family transcriptional regulator [Pseudomonadaceae bacterium]|nr:LysR family transcriptional regulator [Pseudomonadaceae bacterium]
MSSKLPSTRQLEYFVAVARASNFRKAATKLGLSQPALTQQISELETLLAVKLFDRSRAGTLLTPAGRQVLPLAREILEQFASLSEFAEPVNPTLDGSFRLGIAPSVAPSLLPAVFPVLHERYPELRLHVSEHVPEELENGLDNGTFDVILALLPMQAGRHRIRPLFNERLQVVMHRDHPLARKSSLKGRDLHQQDLLTLPRRQQLQKYVQLLCDRYGAQAARDMEANSLGSLRLMLQLNMGIAVLPRLYKETVMAGDDELLGFDLEDEALLRTHVAVWRKLGASRQQFQKLSFEIKSIAMEHFGDVLEEVTTEEHLPETW